jgi:hypothetical protein
MSEFLSQIDRMEVGPFGEGRKSEAKESVNAPRAAAYTTTRDTAQSNATFLSGESFPEAALSTTKSLRDG